MRFDGVHKIIISTSDLYFFTSLHIAANRIEFDTVIERKV